jgi:hypothetical protein
MTNTAPRSCSALTTNAASKAFMCWNTSVAILRRREFSISPRLTGASFPAWSFFYLTNDQELAEHLTQPDAWAPSSYDADASL